MHLLLTKEAPNLGVAEGANKLNTHQSPHENPDTVFRILHCGTE